jgi:hypothetical protein
MFNVKLFLVVEKTSGTEKDDLFYVKGSLTAEEVFLNAFCGFLTGLFRFFFGFCGFLRVF